MSRCMFLREGATLPDARRRPTRLLFLPARLAALVPSDKPLDRQTDRQTEREREDGSQAPLRRSRRFKCLHMQASAIGGP